MDACPGRLNQIHFNIKRSGFYYGQCSEICGTLHSSMPIEINAFNYLNPGRIVLKPVKQISSEQISLFQGKI